MNRDSRTYSYDDHHAISTYPPAHTSQQNAEYPTSGSLQQFDSSSQYYPPSNSEVSNPSSSYYRSMTPSVAPTNRYPSLTHNGRYTNNQTVVSSSSSLSQTVYPPQAAYYPSQYVVASDQRPVPLGQTHQSQFIPTPSEMAHSYSNYNHLAHSHSPSLSEDSYSSTLDYPSPPHIVPSSHGTHVHRPRIITGRPRTSSSAASTSPISNQSPSGERFPCEKCGKTFSRSHDRKRHHETQHLATPIIHRCRFCEKEFSRADSLKRHIDNGCDEMHS